MDPLTAGSLQHGQTTHYIYTRSYMQSIYYRLCGPQEYYTPMCHTSRPTIALLCRVRPPLPKFPHTSLLACAFPLGDKTTLPNYLSTQLKLGIRWEQISIQFVVCLVGFRYKLKVFLWLTPFLNLSMRITPLGKQLSPLQTKASTFLTVFPTTIPMQASIPGLLAEMPLAIIMYSREEVTTADS